MIFRFWVSGFRVSGLRGAGFLGLGLMYCRGLRRFLGLRFRGVSGFRVSGFLGIRGTQ